MKMAIEYIQLQFTASPAGISMNHPGPAGSTGGAPIGPIGPVGTTLTTTKPPATKKTSTGHPRLANRLKTVTDTAYETDALNKIFYGTHDRVRIYDDVFSHLSNQWGTTCGYPEVGDDGFMYQWIFLDKGGLIQHPVILLFIYKKGHIPTEDK